jgi:acetyl-CoA carboxylase, biotin carboxylase subunit
MFYDPLVGKLIIHGGDRINSLATASSVLKELHIEGIKTNIRALLAVTQDERFRSGEYDTGLLGK